MLRHGAREWAEPSLREGAGELSESDVAALWRGVWLNSILLSIAFGLCCGAAVMFATYLSLGVTGENAGYYLHLLGVFLPGYTVTPVGAWIGFFWAFVFAALSGLVVYQIYVRAVGIRALQTMVAAPPSDAYWRMTVRLSGRALGLALGAMLALQLVLSTSWLVARGTAGESRHAALLSNYLPGYTVSIMGSLIGAFWLFLYAFAASLLLAKVYNMLVDRREAARGRSHG
jgi:hypothetical protein